MIKLVVTGRNFEVDAKLREYLEEKLGNLERYLPRQMRDLAAADVILTDDPSGRENNRFVCEAVMTIGGERFVAKEGTINMYAAVDIVDAKLGAQLRSYKEKHTTVPRRTRMLSRFIGRVSEADPSSPEAQVE